MGIFNKQKRLYKDELEDIHKILSRFYDRTKPLQTELDDALRLRMRIKEVLDSLKN